MNRERWMKEVDEISERADAKAHLNRTRVLWQKDPHWLKVWHIYCTVVVLLCLGVAAILTLGSAIKGLHISLQDKP